MAKPLKYTGLCLAAGASIGFSFGALSAPGDLSKNPLFLGQQVPANILWGLDDSGSMGWSIMLTKEARDAHSGANDQDHIDFTPNNSEEIRELCPAYNAMAYNPSLVYTPWFGKDKAGNTYTDRTLTTALDDPFGVFAPNGDVSSPAATVDVSSHFYFVWTDSDGDGKYDNGECPVPTGYGSTLSHAECAGYSGCVRPSDLTAAEQQNYANWYSYYRERSYVLKRAMSEIITKSSMRHGLAGLNDNNKIGTEIKSMDDISLPLDTAARANKEAMLSNLFSSFTKGGTPLRNMLVMAGKYYDTADSPSAGLFGHNPDPSTPILPIDEGGECQQNYTVLMTDGTWNGTVASQGNSDGDNNTEWDGEPYGDEESNTLADVAMRYYETDIALGHDNTVPVILGVDENTAQHMVTYGVAFGVEGSLTDQQIKDIVAEKAGAPDWPEPKPNQITTIDDLAHAAINSRGEYLSAEDPEELITSLNRAIESIANRQGSASAVAFNSTSLETGTMVFQARFNSGTWDGALSAFDFTASGVGTLQWEAGAVLDARDLTADPREIISYNGSKGVAFSFPTDYSTLGADDLSQSQVNDLLTNAPYSSASVVPAEISANQLYGPAITDFLRGVSSNEDGQGGSYTFRNREGKRLGDIVHSGPEFVGVPNRAYPNLIEGVGNEYSTFISDNQSRTPIVYVGANDGMLHGFRASDGKELFAYIPSFLFSDDNNLGLHYLADTNYTHLPYVDDSPLAADIFVSGAWKTYLLGGVRAGGKGIYVLDITSPSSLTESNAASIVKQEFTHNDLGYSFSRPLVGKMNNGRWAAIFGNGYNNDPTGDGRAKLFVLYLDSTGGYDLIDTEVGSMANNNCADASSDCNGLSSSTVLDINGDGTIDRVYAGDVHGNVWAFNLSNSTSSNWDVAHFDSDSNPVPLFSACSATPCTTATRQSITSLSVAKTHPYRVSNSTEPNLMIYVGTGQYITDTDNFSTSTQSMYGIWDAGIAELGRANLQQQVISASATVTGGRDITSNAVNYTTSSELGWYIDLPDSGERIVVEPVVVGDIVFFNTMVPDETSCSGGGYGYLMFADRMTGGQPDFTVLDKNNDGVYDDTIVGGLALSAMPGAARLIDDKLVVSDSSGLISDFGIQTGKARPPSRASWSIFK